MTNGVILPTGGSITVPGSDREIPMSPGEVLIGMAMQELLGELVKVRAAIDALTADPGNPFVAAENALAALNGE